MHMLIVLGLQGSADLVDVGLEGTQFGFKAVLSSILELVGICG